MKTAARDTSPAREGGPALTAFGSSTERALWRLYDLWVPTIASEHLWGCPSERILDLYRQHTSADHLEAGVGSGYFLDRCAFPVADPSLTLLDVNRSAVDVSLDRLRRYRVTGLVASLLEPLPLPGSAFGSVGMNYVVHCIPGALRDKMDAILGHLLPCMKDGGVLFGTTVLGKGVRHNAAGGPFAAAMQRLGIFKNQDDDLPGLEAALKRHVSDYAIEPVGRTAVFIARKPGRAEATPG
ncbi:class I SAM-dependent methyltransferase [Sorangium sp. So ce861]|uniref:class I SAM-dependent methyltransferase n=1 Tax=Sorangium sp. So ce861 TaxID=3133323 RepID=UPI003F5D85D1